MVLPGLDIDDQATASKVRKFLTKDLDKYLALSGAQRDNLKSPTITGMPKATPVGNATEDHFLDVIIAEVTIDCVKRAIANCTLTSRNILTLCYLDCLTDWKVAQRLDYSPSRYNDLKRKALCEFAGRYRYQAMHAGISDSELNVYK